MADLKELAGKMKVDIPKGDNLPTPTSANKSDTNTKQSNDNNASSTKRRTWLENTAGDSISLIEPDDIANWDFHDRPENELGDIEALAKDFISIGQQQPCVVRPTPIGHKKKYELIIGERRWRAAKHSNTKLKVIIKELSDSEAALAQAAENDNRKDLSDFAKGMYYSKLIDAGILKQSDIVEKLNKSRQYVSALLSFSKIPEPILNAIDDLTLVSSRTAETIKRLSSKGEEYVQAIVSKAEQIKSGRLGANKLAEVVEELVQTPVRSKKEVKKIIVDGMHVASLRPRDNNYLPSLHFPKPIVDYIENMGMSLDGDFAEEIGKFIISYINTHKVSAHADNSKTKGGEMK